MNMWVRKTYQHSIQQKTYEITFSDFVSKFDVMQKWRRKQKERKMTTSINWTNIGLFLFLRTVAKQSTCPLNRHWLITHRWLMYCTGPTGLRPVGSVCNTSTVHKPRQPIKNQCAKPNSAACTCCSLYFKSLTSSLWPKVRNEHFQVNKEQMFFLSSYKRLDFDISRSCCTLSADSLIKEEKAGIFSIMLAYF